MVEIARALASDSRLIIMDEPTAPLTPKEVATLTEWVKQGAKYATHWAYVTPARPPLPGRGTAEGIFHVETRARPEAPVRRLRHAFL